jgi:hypothetical protein
MAVELNFFCGDERYVALTLSQAKRYRKAPHNLKTRLQSDPCMAIAFAAR